MNEKRFKPGVFIVIEGLDCSGKTTLVERLSAALDACSLRSPPSLVAASFGEDDLRRHFDGQPAVVRRQYYRFGNLLASEMAKLALSAGRTVVMDRYWTSTAAFAAALDDGDGLAEFADSYPPELLAPDLVVLLTVDEESRGQRLVGRGVPATDEERRLADEADSRQAVLAAYRRFSPIEVDTSGLDPQSVLDAVLALLHQHLS